LEDKVFNLTEVERSSYEQDDLFIMNKKNQIYDLKETQAILVSVLKQKQRGFRSPAQKEKIECAKPFGIRFGRCSFDCVRKSWLYRCFVRICYVGIAFPDR
jgi:hypothetical protein